MCQNVANRSRSSGDSFSHELFSIVPDNLIPWQLKACNRWWTRLLYISRSHGRCHRVNGPESKSDLHNYYHGCCECRSFASSIWHADILMKTKHICEAKSGYTYQSNRRLSCCPLTTCEWAAIPPTVSGFWICSRHPPTTVLTSSHIRHMRVKCLANFLAFSYCCSLAFGRYVDICLPPILWRTNVQWSQYT